MSTDGLMTLRDRTFRTLTILSARPDSWAAIRDYGTDSVADRFAVPRQVCADPGTVAAAEAARAAETEDTAGFAAKGGVALPIPATDLTVFAALDALAKEHYPALNAWLAARRPAHSTSVLRSAPGTQALVDPADPDFVDPALADTSAVGPSPADAPPAAALASGG